MKQSSQSIISSTTSLPGRLTKVTTLGCLLALVCLMATSAQAQTSGKARPFKATGIPTLSGGIFEFVGTATHLGNFDFPGTYVFSRDPRLTWPLVYHHIHGTYTAANGDTIEVDCPNWESNYGVSPVTSWGLVNIIGGTGRFANASGWYVGELLGALQYGDAPTLFTAEGAIAY